MAKLGVVIFDDDYFSEEGLAALKWASDFLKKPQLVRILLIKEKEMENEPVSEDISKGKLSALVDNIGKEKNVPDELINMFDNYKKEFGTKNDVSGRSYQGLNIQKMLEGAIQSFQLDTLVLGMAALRKTSIAGRIHLLLDSDCSIVLVKKDPKPLLLKTTTVEIPDPDPVDPKQKKKTKTKTVTKGDGSGTSGQKDPKKTDESNQNKGDKSNKSKANKK